MLRPVVRRPGRQCGRPYFRSLDSISRRFRGQHDAKARLTAHHPVVGVRRLFQRKVSMSGRMLDNTVKSMVSSESVAVPDGHPVMERRKEMRASGEPRSAPWMLRSPSISRPPQAGHGAAHGLGIVSVARITRAPRVSSMPGPRPASYCRCNGGRQTARQRLLVASAGDGDRVAAHPG